MSISVSNRENSRAKYAATVSALTLSFWSSGVVLIRMLHSYELWSSPALLGTMFVLSVPMVSMSIYGVRSMFSTSGDNALVYDTLQGVLLMHGVALGFFAKMYSFMPSGEISAAAWLLWFGGIAVVFTRHKIVS